MTRSIMIGVVSGIVLIVLWNLITRQRPIQLTLDGHVLKSEDLADFVPNFPASRSVTPRMRPGNFDTIIPEVRFEKTPFKDVIEYLRKATGANIVVIWTNIRSLSEDTVDLHVSNLPASRVLALVLEPRGATYRIDDGIVKVGDAEQLDFYRRVVRVYNVRDLLIDAMRFGRSFHSASGLTTRPASPFHRHEYSVVAGSISAGTIWRTVPSSGAYPTEAELVQALRHLLLGRLFPSDEFRVDYWAGRLVILETPEKHEKIENLLAELRAE